MIHLHRHSEYSLLDGLGTAKQYAEKAASYGQDALALTDHGNLSGAIAHYEACKEVGIKPIIGMEAYYKPNRHLKDADNKKSYHLVLLAKNKEGFVNLIRMSSEAYRSGFYYKPCVDDELLAEYSEGIICNTACMSSYMNNLILQGDSEGANKEVLKLKNIFKDDLNFEIMPHDFDEQRTLNNALVGMANEHSVPLIGTVDAHYPHEGWHDTQDIVLMIATGQTFERRKEKYEKGEDVYKFECDSLWLMPQKEAEDLFIKNNPNIPKNILSDAIVNTHFVADKIEQFNISKSKKMPKIKGDSRNLLYDLSVKGLEKEFGKDFPEEYEERLCYELDVMQDLDALDYVYIVADIVQYAHDNNIRVGPGRGSAAGSLVCYATGITQVNPITYGLMFERFLNPDRVSMPDIDVDFSSDGRKQIKAYVAEKYGRDKVADICSHQRFQPKAALKKVSTVFDVPFKDINAVTKIIDDKEHDNLDEILQVYDEVEEFKNKYPEVWHHAHRVEGQVHTLSKHAGGVVVADRPLNDFMPTMKSKDDSVITGWSDSAALPIISKYGMTKIDILGIKSLQMQEEACQLIEEMTGEQIRLNSLDIRNDPFSAEREVLDQFSKGLVCGVFQFTGSSEFATLIKNIKPDSIFDIAVANAIYRPGPMGGNVHTSFYKRKHGLEKIDYFHDDAEDVLKETYGLIIYQEQVMKLAQILAGFSNGDADDLRKVMGKEYRLGMRHVVKYLKNNGYEDKWREGCLEYGLSDQLTDKLWTFIVSFGGYGFNKSHAVAYAIQAYQDMWLKTHYPFAFYTALLTKNPKIISDVIREASMFDVNISLPDINKSQLGFWPVSQKEILFGLQAIKGLGDKGIKQIITNRPYESYDEFEESIPAKSVNSRAKEALIGSGAFDKLGLRDTWNDEEKSSAETELIGFGLSKKDLVRENYDKLKLYLNTKEELVSEQEGSSATIGGEVTRLNAITTKNGREMAFAQINFLGEEWRMTIFPDTWIMYKTLFKKGNFIISKAKKNFYNDEESYVISYACSIEEFLEMVN